MERTLVRAASRVGMVGKRSRMVGYWGTKVVKYGATQRRTDETKW